MKLFSFFLTRRFHWARPVNNIASEKYPHNLRAKLFNMPPDIDTCQNGQHYQKQTAIITEAKTDRGFFSFALFMEIVFSSVTSSLPSLSTVYTA